ncbi:MAG: hypothetical protein J5I50_09070 [Chitinophagaceae bacterium]|nr:hypothetical protein [Chitinophagaceae bacterium]
MRLYFIFILMIAALPSMAQKKMVPADYSAITGIRLPDNSKQDKRGLSVAAARVVLNDESKKNKSEIRETEVFILPSEKASGYSSDSIINALEDKGWEVMPLAHDNKYGWLKKGDEFAMIYFSTEAKATNVYIGKSKTRPVFDNILNAGKDPAAVKTENRTTVQNPMPTNTVPVAHGTFTFDRTNWDDGWVSTIESDKVVVTKGNVKVYIYFPVQHNDETRRQGRDYYWDNYIAKQFRILSKQYQDKGEVMSAFQPPYIEGKAIDPATGKNCFLGFYVTTGSGIMYPTLVVAPDAATLWATFPKANDLNNSDIPVMRNYNKFAIAQSDLAGTWSGGDFGAMNYYNAYSGNYQGMGAVAMSDEFTFNADGTYSSKHSGASGMVGNMQTYSQNYKGKATVSNWEIVLPNRFGGKTSTYYAYFEVIPGGRVLHLQDKQYTGMTYALVRKQ